MPNNGVLRDVGRSIAASVAPPALQLLDGAQPLEPSVKKFEAGRQLWPALRHEDVVGDDGTVIPNDEVQHLHTEIHI